MFECQGSSPKLILIRVPSRRTRSITHVCYDLVLCSLACQLLPLCMEMCSDAKMCCYGCPWKTWVDHRSWWSSLCFPNATAIVAVAFSDYPCVLRSCGVSHRLSAPYRNAQRSPRPVHVKRYLHSFRREYFAFTARAALPDVMILRFIATNLAGTVVVPGRVGQYWFYCLLR